MYEKNGNILIGCLFFLQIFFDFHHLLLSKSISRFLAKYKNKDGKAISFYFIKLIAQTRKLQIYIFFLGLCLHTFDIICIFGALKIKSKIIMTQQYYEIESNFTSVFSTALALIKAMGHNDVYQLLSNSKPSVAVTNYDNWNGGTYGYTVNIGLSVKQYSSYTSAEINNMQKIVSDALNEAIKGDGNNYFNAEITPSLSKDDIDWDIVGGLNGKAKLKQNIETIKNIMVSVATGGNRIQDEETRYKSIHNQIQTDCKNLNIPYNNGFTSLWDWYGKWKADFPTYKERRIYVKDIFEQTLAYFEESDKQEVTDTFVELDDWDKIKRTVKKIKIDSLSAVNEEDFQTIGLLCRDVIISLAQAVYDPIIHGDTHEDGTKIGNADAVRMIGNYVNYTLGGSSNKELKGYAKTTNALANQLTHKRTATKKDMLLAVSSTIALINFIGIIEEKY